MNRRPTRSTRTLTLFPYTTVCRPPQIIELAANRVIGPAVFVCQKIVRVRSGGVVIAPHDARPHSANAEAADLRLAKEKAVGKAHVLTQPLDIAAFRAQRENEPAVAKPPELLRLGAGARSEEHTSELQSLMRISYAVFCLKQKRHQ